MSSFPYFRKLRPFNAHRQNTKEHELGHSRKMFGVISSPNKRSSFSPTPVQKNETGLKCINYNGDRRNY